MPQDKRPPHRNRRFTVPLDDETYEAAVKKATSPSRLRAILRLFLDLWSHDEWPPEMDFSEEDIEEQARRAKKVPRKRKKTGE
jgi:hypothetical protein